MSISVNVSGVFKTCRVLWVNSSGWKAVKNAWYKNGSTWTLFYQAAPSVSVSATSVIVPYSVSRIGGNLTWTPIGPSPAVTATASGGVGPYTYSWVITTNPTLWGVGSPGSPTTTFSGTTSVGAPPLAGVATVTVTDSATHLQAQATVSVSS